MNPINPWLDPAEVRRLAEKLLAPIHQTLDEPSADPGFDSGFVGFASNPPAPARPAAAVPLPPAAAVVQPIPAAPPPVAARERQAPARPDEAPVVPRERRAPARPDEAPVPTPVTAPAPAAPPLEAPAAVPAATAQAASGPFLDRLHHFRDWLHRHFAATGIFILDRDGAVIFDDSGHGKHHFLARSLALASRRPGCPSGNVHVKIGTTAALEVIPVETPYGWLVLGAVVPAAMPPAAIPVIVEALTQAVAPSGQNSG